MIACLFAISFIGSLVCASLLTRDFYRHHREEWETAERPIGPLWAPSGQRQELLNSWGSRSSRMGMLLLMNLLVFPPPATGYPMRLVIKPMLYAYRALFIANGILLITLLVKS